jgi:aldehyde dehydrogenase (NAD+)
MTKDYTQHYINGEWINSSGDQVLGVVNPATEEVITDISLGTKEDVDAAVKAAKRAFPSWSQTSVEVRIELLGKIVDGMMKRSEDLIQAVSNEMGAPISLATNAQIPAGIGHFKTAIKVLKDYSFTEDRGETRIVKEPIGVCGFITPWNWPLNQIACKVAPALATGCTMILKPSEIAPLDAYLLAEIIHDAGIPAGVFNLVNGDGIGVGSAISAHPDIDMVSFTGSTRAGVLVAQAAAPSVKRVTQELGGKSANIILENADLQRAVRTGVAHCFKNSGQSCNAPTRMLVPASIHDDALAIAKETAEATIAGDPSAEGTTIGPVISEVQYNKIQGLIQKGIDEGATLVAGGLNRPDDCEKGYYVKPTVFGNVNNDMTIAREEVFGPVLSIIPYETIDEAVEIANDSEYGLAGYVFGETVEDTAQVATRLRTGMVHLNGAANDQRAPFGGYKKSGNGREWGIDGFEEFLELKAIMGHNV